MPQEISNDEIKDIRISDTIKRFTTPILIAVVAYFIKAKLENIEATLDTLARNSPLYELRITNLERTISSMTEEVKDLRREIYFLKPEEIKIQSFKK